MRLLKYDRRRSGIGRLFKFINVFAVTEDPLAISELTGFFSYDGLAPYAFPEMSNARSGVIELTSESNPGPSQLGGSDRYEFALTFDSPLLVENSGSFWVGVGLHGGERTCLSNVDIARPVGYAFSGGQALPIADLNGL